MDENLANAFYGISFFLSLFVLVGLWRIAAKFPVTSRLWSLLALAWTLNLIADLVWGILVFVAPDIWLDWIDYLYIGRYLLVFAAFWLYPQPWGWRQWVAMFASMLIGWLLVWLLLARPADNPDPSYALAGMIFPVMDVGILFGAIYRWRMAEAAMQKTLLWLSVAMFAYGAANWFNYSVRVTKPEADSLLALILWLLSTVFTGVAVWQFWKRTE
ncbi:MAG: hypothetical protein ACK2T5_09685 [Anaerolineales bacterium]